MIMVISYEVKVIAADVFRLYSMKPYYKWRALYLLVEAITNIQAHRLLLQPTVSWFQWQICMTVLLNMLTALPILLIWLQLIIICSLILKSTFGLELGLDWWCLAIDENCYQHNKSSSTYSNNYYRCICTTKVFMMETIFHLFTFHMSILVRLSTCQPNFLLYILLIRHTELWNIQLKW